jgi:hypothetical protein
LVVLFAKCLSWHEVSKTSITLHEFPSHDHLLIHEDFGGKFINLKMVHYENFLPLLICAWSVFKCIWSLVWYCSRLELPCTTKFPIFAMHPYLA